MGLFGGSSDQSSASSTAGLNFNSSGWVVGNGNANGGGMSSADGGLGALPWYAWASVASVVGAFFYYKKKRGK